MSRCVYIMLPPSQGFPWRKPGGPGRLPAQGSHRSGRARLAHPAPRDTGSLRGAHHRVQFWWREWVPLQECEKAIPVHAGCARATTEPPSPDRHDLVTQASEGVHVADDSEVAIVPTKLANEVLVLLGDRAVPIPSTPFRDAVHRPGETTPGRLLLYHPGSLSRATPVIVESQEVEASGGKPVFP